LSGPFDPLQVDAISEGVYRIQGIQSELSYQVWVDDSRGIIGAGYPSPVIPSANQQVTNIDITLQTGAYASGRIYDPATNGGGAGMYAQLYDVNGNPVGGINFIGYFDATPSDAQGNYFSPAVQPGQYYLGINGNTGTILYPNVKSNLNCSYNTCDFSQAQLFDFSATQEYSNIDFAIQNLDLVFRGNFE